MFISVHVKVDAAVLEAVIGKVPETEAYIASQGAADTALNAKMVVPIRTGNLWSSIDYETEGGKSIVTAAAYYALYVEMGTYKMAAQPYMRPGLESVDWETIAGQAFANIGL